MPNCTKLKPKTENRQSGTKRSNPESHNFDRVDQKYGGSEKTWEVELDPQNVNKALKKSHYPVSAIEEILPPLSKAKEFTILDQRC